jgi:3-deoxy-D-arabino-heptulosonate 7-phosphate (DAHP) synthase class II
MLILIDTGIQVSDTMVPVKLVKLCEVPTHATYKGRLMVIVHMGSKNLQEKLLALGQAVHAGCIATVGL